MNIGVYIISGKAQTRIIMNGEGIGRRKLGRGRGDGGNGRHNLGEKKWGTKLMSPKRIFEENSF